MESEMAIGLWLLFLTERSITVASLVGFIALCGIAARNGIMMISHFKHLEDEEGVPFGPDLVIRGARERLAPILMTALATGLAIILAGRRVALLVLGGFLAFGLLGLWEESIDTLALTLARKSTGRVDGFVVEGPTAGGHNAPPRGKLQLSPEGEPIYGERDAVDLDKLRDFYREQGYLDVEIAALPHLLPRRRTAQQDAAPAAGHRRRRQCAGTGLSQADGRSTRPQARREGGGVGR